MSNLLKLLINNVMAPSLANRDIFGINRMSNLHNALHSPCLGSHNFLLVGIVGIQLINPPNQLSMNFSFIDIELYNIVITINGY